MTVAASPDIRIRVAREDDAPALLAVFAPYVEETAITFEYEVPTVEEFARRIRETLKTHPYLVAETTGANGRILGYAFAHPYNYRDAYAWCSELTIYLDRDARGMGLGRRLYEALEHVLGKMGVLNLYACITSAEPECPYVPPTSVAFHAALGYRVIGRFDQSGYKFGRWFDMVWMEKNLGEHVADVMPIVLFPELEGVETLLV